MTIQQLSYVVALDNTRHFVNAADQCFVTQPTLTMQLKKLEEELGVIIFDRSKHPIEPTPVGAQIILKARQILREANQMKEIICDQRDSLKGTYRIGVIPTLAPYLLPLFILGFVDQHPECNITIEEKQSDRIIDELKQDKLDIGILVTPLEDDELREIPVFNEPFVVYSSETHPFYEAVEVSPDQIRPEGLLLLNQGHCFRNQVLNICKKLTKQNTSNFQYESGSIETIRRLIDRGTGYTLLPALAITSDMNPKRIKQFTDPKPSREVSIVVHNSFARESFVQTLRSAIVEVIPREIISSKALIKVKWR